MPDVDGRRVLVIGRLQDDEFSGLLASHEEAADGGVRRRGEIEQRRSTHPSILKAAATITEETPAPVELLEVLGLSLCPLPPRLGYTFGPRSASIVDDAGSAPISFELLADKAAVVIAQLGTAGESYLCRRVSFVAVARIEMPLEKGTNLASQGPLVRGGRPLEAGPELGVEEHRDRRRRAPIE